MRTLFGTLLAAGLAACAGAAGGNAWVNERPKSAAPRTSDDGWLGAPIAAARPAPSDDARELPPAPIDREPDAIAVQDLGDGVPRAVLTAGLDAVFRNTYYDFPREGGGDKAATIYDAACAPIAKVTTDFHDRVCVQGSGRLAGGETVSFAKRDCACAATCPRTGQRICYERLDPARFPHGRGALGRAITPLFTVAVDSSVIPLGTRLFIPEFVGLPRPDGSLHDGCFLAEDRGLKVVGRQIDVFTGDPTLTARWNVLMPSNRGVHVTLNDTRCAAR